MLLKSPDNQRLPEKSHWSAGTQSLVIFPKSVCLGCLETSICGTFVSAWQKTVIGIKKRKKRNGLADKRHEKDHASTQPQWRRLYSWSPAVPNHILQIGLKRIQGSKFLWWQKLCWVGRGGVSRLLSSATWQLPKHLTAVGCKLKDGVPRVWEGKQWTLGNN